MLHDALACLLLGVALALHSEVLVPLGVGIALLGPLS